VAPDPGAPAETAPLASQRPAAVALPAVLKAAPTHLAMANVAMHASAVVLGVQSSRPNAALAASARMDVSVAGLHLLKRFLLLKDNV